MKREQKSEFLSSRVRYIPINTIQPNPQQPRRRFDEAGLRELADSIAAYAEAEPYITRRGPKWHVDLKGVNARWLEKAGVRQIDVSPDCTACHPELYWSHRRMGQARGAQIAMICL